MTQADLFPVEETPLEWRRIPGFNGGKCFARWVHRSGWEVHHCGHPTALFPYYVEAPDGRSFIAANGRGFMHLAAANAAILNPALLGRKSEDTNSRGESP
jgi:hypothetical protein